MSPSLRVGARYPFAPPAHSVDGKVHSAPESHHSYDLSGS